MTPLNLRSPLTFHPIFQERIWGGRKLEDVYGKKLPTNRLIGESWELVDRAEAQSIVQNGALAGKTLHELWTMFRREIFGDLTETERFPLLLKILDASEKLSVQVHPPAEAARELSAEAKTEFWFIAQAEAQAEIYAGLKLGRTRDDLETALQNGTVEEHLHRIPVRAGDAMFLPSGRLHAIGGGNLIIEIQQNSDTTYRVFDWNRLDQNGNPRKLHLDQSFRSIDFTDCEPSLVQADGESLVRHELFEVERWRLFAARESVQLGRFAVIACLNGELECGGVRLQPGEFFLIPASLRDRTLHPLQAQTSVLRVTIS